ncbi:hypothetical protein QBC38DRAFT_483007 [Podospora fimiseda]|uniref:Uncharacterized protein n=1 Tax=Podospora fimiseda TaxID=252190 RepID=A0AAN7GRR8_9PEZI|nr:hypothetical protein QBC38DRAFT_483007 [Podospora fimiseda]
MVSIKIIASLAAVALTASAAPVADEAPLPGYQVQVLEWEVQPTPGSVPIKIRGTVQDAVAAIAKVNPNIKRDIAAYAAAASATSPVQDEASELFKRQNYESHFCYGRWAPALDEAIQQGIAHLRAVSGRPSNGPAPNNCGRVSCSQNSAIWWCNDLSTTQTLNSFSDIGRGASTIRDSCRRRRSDGVWEASGQCFFTQKWNVIVRKDTC